MVQKREEASLDPEKVRHLASQARAEAFRSN